MDIVRKYLYQIDRTVKPGKIKEALELLETAGIVRRIRQTSGAGLPLSVGVHESIFKVLFLDVGLMHAVCGIYSETALENDFTAIFRGAVAKQLMVLRYRRCLFMPSKVFLKWEV